VSLSLIIYLRNTHSDDTKLWQDYNILKAERVTRMLELNTPYFSHCSQCHMSVSNIIIITMQNTRRSVQFKSAIFFKPKTSRCVLPYHKWVCTIRPHNCLLTLLLVFISAMATCFDPYLGHLQASIHVKIKISREIILHIKHTMEKYVSTGLKMIWIWVETCCHCVYNN
jgi:hypothetical protein